MKLSDKEIRRIAETISMIPPGVNSILEAGCGDGRITNIIGRYYNITGIDIDRKKIKDVSGKKAVADISRIPAKNDAYDLVISAEVIEHLDDEVFNRALKEMVRVSRKYILISVPFKENLPAQWKKCSRCGRIFHRWGHIRKFDFKIINGLCEGAEVAEKRFFSLKETRIPSVMYMCARIIGGVWGKEKGMPEPCPDCGGPSIKSEGNLFGKLFIRFIWRIEQAGIAKKPTWVCVLYRKK